MLSVFRYLLCLLPFPVFLCLTDSFLIAAVSLYNPLKKVKKFLGAVRENGSKTETALYGKE